VDYKFREERFDFICICTPGFKQEAYKNLE